MICQRRDMENFYTFKCVSKHNTIKRFYVNIFKFLICILHLPLNLENYIWVVKFEKLYFYFGYEIFILDVKKVRNIRIPTSFFLFVLDKEFLLPVKGLSTLNILRNPKVPGLFWPWKEVAVTTLFLPNLSKVPIKVGSIGKKYPLIKQIIYGI